VNNVGILYTVIAKIFANRPNHCFETRFFSGTQLASPIGLLRTSTKPEYTIVIKRVRHARG
jgi:hypothetical protein